MALLMFLLQEVAPTPSFQERIISMVFDNLPLLCGAVLVWYRFGRNAEKVLASIGRIGELGELVMDIKETLAGVKEILAKHEVRLDFHQKELDRIRRK